MKKYVCGIADNVLYICTYALSITELYMYVHSYTIFFMKFIIGNNNNQLLESEGGATNDETGKYLKILHYRLLIFLAFSYRKCKIPEKK